MAGMTQARKQVTEDLKAIGLTVKESIPEKVVPPLVFLRAGNPMLEESDTMNGDEFNYHLELWVIVKNKPNQESTDNLETLIEKVLYNLGDWAVTNVGPLTMLTYGDAEYPSAVISITNTITIEGGE